MTTRMSIASCIAASLLAAAMFAAQSPPLAADGLKCDMTQYKAGTGLTAAMEQDLLVAINPESLLLEGARRVDEWSLIE